MKYIQLLLFTLWLLARLSFASELDQLGEQMNNFYLDPSAEQFALFQEQLDNHGSLLKNNQNVASLLASVMLARVHQKYKWPIISSEFGENARLIIEGDNELSNFVNDDALVNPTKLDVWWASFFGTGDEKYLKNIYDYVGKDLSKECNTELMLVYAAASWSFQVNCKQHVKVVEFARSKIREPSLPEYKKEFLRECIDFATKHPTEG